MRIALAALVVLVMGGAVAGVGMGEAPAARERAPSPAEVQAARQRIAALPHQQGRRLFAAEGCDRCHALAAVGAEGMLGPRLDALDDDAEDIAESITDPREDTDDDYSERLMPADFAQRLDDPQIEALSAFVAAASGDEGDEGDDDGDPGRGRGRGGRD